MFITDRLQSIERQQGAISKEPQSYLENKTDHAVSFSEAGLRSDPSAHRRGQNVVSTIERLEPF